MTSLVIGVDPGQTTGVCVFDLDLRVAEHLQCTPGAVLTVIGALAGQTSAPVLIAVERFVVGPRASRSASAKAAQTTRELIGKVLGLASEKAHIRVVQRSAAEVKPWATDERLQRAELFAKGMRHANDAARHALYAAVKDAGFPDPLSRSSRPRRTACRETA